MWISPSFMDAEISDSFYDIGTLTRVGTAQSPETAPVA